jgi:hypothetical protein
VPVRSARLDRRAGPGDGVATGSGPGAPGMAGYATIVGGSAMAAGIGAPGRGTGTAARDVEDGGSARRTPGDGHAVAYGAGFAWGGGGGGTDPRAGPG